MTYIKLETGVTDWLRVYSNVLDDIHLWTCPCLFPLACAWYFDIFFQFIIIINQAFALQSATCPVRKYKKRTGGYAGYGAPQLEGITVCRYVI